MDLHLPDRLEQMTKSTGSKTPDMDGLTRKVTSRFEDLRDRTARTLGAEDSPSFRELGRVRSRIDDFEKSVTSLLSDFADRQERLASELHSSSKRTTFPRKLFWMLVGATGAAVATYLADPDRGRARRAELSQQLAARARDAQEQARKKAEMVQGQVRGAAVETAKQALPEDVPADPRVLEQRIKSEVFGYRDDVQDVVVKVDAPGTVALKGTVPSASSEQELLGAVGDVEGVVDVRSELTISSR